MAWSYDLLDDERRLFARLSIFAGTFDLAAAEEVCSGGGIGREQILDLLARLVDKSLVSVLRAGGMSRLTEPLTAVTQVCALSELCALGCAADAAHN